MPGRLDRRRTALMALSEMHPETGAAHDLLRDGHFVEAIRSASQRYLDRIEGIAYASEHPELRKARGRTAARRLFELQNNPLGSPHLRFNELSTESELNQQEGYFNLAYGLILSLRNPATHDPDMEVSEAEAFEWIAFISVMHRRLDAAIVVGEPPTGNERAEPG